MLISIAVVGCLDLGSSHRKQSISTRKHTESHNEFQVQIFAAICKDFLSKHHRMLICFIVPEKYPRLNVSSALLHAEI